MRRPRTRTIAIDQTTAGTTILVAARAGAQIRVLNYTVVMDGAGTYKFRTASREISGAIPAEDRGGASPVGGPDSPVLLGDLGANLSIVTTTGAAKGHITVQITPGG